MTTTETPTAAHYAVHIDHVEPRTTLIMILANDGVALPTLTIRGETFDVEGFTIWRTSRGTWNVEAGGLDVMERSTRERAVNAALRSVGIRRNDPHAWITEDTEY